MSVEVLISTYNRLDYLKKAIESVLNQSYSEFVLTIVNSGSTDATKEFVNSLHDSRINFIEFKDNLGISGNIERAFSQTSKRYVVLFHDDDEMEKDFIKIYMNNLENEVVVYHSDVTFIDAQSNPIQKERPIVRSLIKKHEYAKVVVLDRNSASIVMPTVMVDTNRIKEKGGWPLALDPNLTMLVDMGIWIQINQFGAFKYIDKALLKYRLHQQSGTSIYAKKVVEMFKNRLSIFKVIYSGVPAGILRFYAFRFLLKSIAFDFKNLFR